MKRADHAPPFSSRQRSAILELLRAAGPEGVSKAFLIFDKHYTQASARIFELEEKGYVIRHETRPGEKYVRFVLISEPATVPPSPEKSPSLFSQGTLPLCAALEGRE